MDTQELHDRGLKLRQQMFGEAAVARRMNAFGEFGAPLQHIINAYAYGDVWQRDALPATTKSLAMVAMMAALGKPNELRVHLNGALKNGARPSRSRSYCCSLRSTAASRPPTRHIRSRSTSSTSARRQRGRRRAAA